MWLFIATSWLILCVGEASAKPALDSDQPVDITADELEVRQQEQRAIFSGNVIAKQGNITMQSARMIVFYDGQGENSISKIEADGGVFFSSPAETARSGKAIYDVMNEQIRMLGDVTLTRDQSVLKGSGLVYNLKSGRSVLSSGKGAKDGERVRGLFVPGQGSAK